MNAPFVITSYSIHYTKLYDFSPEDYARLLNNTRCMVGNSSSGLREAAFLGTPSVFDALGGKRKSREKSYNFV